MGAMGEGNGFFGFADHIQNRSDTVFIEVHADAQIDFAVSGIG